MPELHVHFCPGCDFVEWCRDQDCRRPRREPCDGCEADRRLADFNDGDFERDAYRPPAP